MMMVENYVKRPVVIEALKYTGNNGSEVADFVGDSLGNRVGCDLAVKIIINTLEGPMHVAPGDYVIKGIKGEFYPCKPDIFESTYDKCEQL